MPLNILVAFATKKGSTHEVATVVAEELRGRGADVRDVTAYDGVVLGGSLYMGRWHPDARRLLQRQSAELAARSLAVFGIGPLTSGPDDLASARRQLDHTLDKLTEVHPATVAIFGGVVDPGKLHFPFNRMQATDARDWDQIRNWARTVAATFAVAMTPARS